MWDLGRLPTLSVTQFLHLIKGLIIECIISVLFNVLNYLHF